MSDWGWRAVGAIIFLLLVWLTRWNNRRLDRNREKELMRKWQSSRYNPRRPYMWDDENTGS